MTLNAAHLVQVLRSIPGAYGRQIASLDVLAAGATRALLTAPAGLTVQGAAAFLATMSQESASLRATEEYAKHGRYAPYIGRTFEMVTWQANYAAFGAWCAQHGLLADPQAFVKTPAKLADIEWAWLGGVWFWQAHGLWAYANRGDFLAVQRAVNLGSPTSKATPVGYPTRKAWYAAWLQLGDALLPTAPVTPSTGRPIDMATASDIYLKFNGKQPLTPGEQADVLIDAAQPTPGKSIVVGASDGVDILATVEVKTSDGNRYDGPVLKFFKVVSYKQGTPTTTTTSRIATTSDQASFKGSIAADPDSTRSPRLRLVVDVPADAPAGLTIDWVQLTGWRL